MNINAKNVDFKDLNDDLRDINGELTVENCLGQRFMAA